MINRISEKIKKSSGCWEWTGSKSKGYGYVRWRGKPRIASRVIWEIENGEIPPGMFVCHKCDNPSCVRLSHLFLGTPKENAEDCIRKGRHRAKSNEDHWNSKLTMTAASEIREFCRIQKYGNQIAMARKFGVCRGTIELILRNRIWRNRP